MRNATLLMLGLSVQLLHAQNTTVTTPNSQPGSISAEFIAEHPAAPSCHASTIVEGEKPGELLAAWFGGSDEGARDVVIWLSRNEGRGWSRPEEVANGVHDAVRIQYPCWNPVLFKMRNGPLLLFYKEGPTPSSWWGMLKTSEDNGATWSRPKKLPAGIFGPIRAKPIELAGGTLFCGSSSETDGWRVRIEKTKKPLSDQAWSRTAPLNRALDWAAIQPTILEWPDGNIQILCRTKQDVITECWSGDRGETWSRMKATELPNPSAGIDAVMLKDNRGLLVYNHATSGRGTLNLAVTPEGRRWFAAMVLENTPGAEFSYPAAIQTSDGLVHITYTWQRKKIKHVVIDPAQLTLKEMVNGQWPQ
jgi:predicted neuraminidase